MGLVLALSGKLSLEALRGAVLASKETDHSEGHPFQKFNLQVGSGHNWTLKFG